MVFPTALLVFIFAALSIANAANLRRQLRSGCTPGDNSFDYYDLVLQYPPTFHENFDHFTLHGLWPSRSGSEVKSYPCECKKIQFEMSALDSIMSEMKVDWPSFGHPNESFWSHEFQKHGTCSNMDELDYFKAALKLRDDADVMAKLKSAGITPSNEKGYELDTLSSALKNGTGHLVAIGCKKNDGVQYLSELGLCHSKDLEQIDCDLAVRSPENNLCDSDMPVYLAVMGGSPITPPHSHSPSPSPSGDQCVPNKHGPSCTSDNECARYKGCVRCARSGHCTTDLPNSDSFALVA